MPNSKRLPRREDDLAARVVTFENKLLDLTDVVAEVLSRLKVLEELVERRRRNEAATDWPR